MMPLHRRFIVFALRTGIAAACCLGIWCSWKLARADRLFHQDTSQSVRAAIALAPDDWEYYMRLSLLDRDHAMELLAKAQSLDRYNAQADIELGLQYESQGNYRRAEELLLDAFDVDHTYLPRWSLANFYFRRDNMPAFWVWSRKAAAMPADDVGPLFELCWRVAPDPEKISKAILNDNPALIRQYVVFLLAKDQLQAAAEIAPRLVRAGDAQADGALLLALVNRLLAANAATAADGLWRLLIRRGWVVADDTVPNNAGFKREPLPVSFDWAFPEYSGLHSWPGASGLETEFTGVQPEDCTIAEQILPLAPGNYLLTYSYRTEDIPLATGIHWQAVDASSNAVLAESSDLSSEVLATSFMRFSVPPNTLLVRLRLKYRRTLGTPRVSGMLVMQSTRIEATAASQLPRPDGDAAK